MEGKNQLETPGITYWFPITNHLERTEVIELRKMPLYVTDLRYLKFLPKAVCSSPDRMNCACKDIPPFPPPCRAPATAELLSICWPTLFQSFQMLHWCSLGSGCCLWTCRFSRICPYWAYSVANNTKSAKGASNNVTILQSLVKNN